MASLNPAQWHGLSDLGAIAPGYQADLLVLPELKTLRARARAEARAGRSSEIPRARGAGVGEAHGPDSRGRVEPLRDPVGRRARARDRHRPRPDRDRVARRGADAEGGWRSPTPSATSPRSPSSSATSARAGSASASSAASACSSGALASTVAHDAHNIVVVGMDDDDMARAVDAPRRARRRRWSSSRAAACAPSCPLPVAGLLSDAPLDEVLERSRACVDAARKLGLRPARRRSRRSRSSRSP